MDSVNPQAPSPPLSAGLALKLYRYRSLIRRHWWVLALTVGLGLAIEAYVMFSNPQMYESSAQLIIREELVNETRGATFNDPWGNVFGTAIELLKNPMVLDKAKSRLALEAPQLGSASVEINSSVAPHTNIFTVTGTGPNGEFTQRFVDAVVDEFLIMRKYNRNETVQEIGHGMKDQLTQLRAELARQQAEFQAFVTANNMAFWSEQASSAATFLSGLKNQQTQLNNELTRLQNLTPDELLQTPVTGTPNPNPGPNPKPQGGASEPKTAAPAVQFNGELYSQFTQTTQQLLERQAEVEYWKTIWKPKHPKMQALDQEVEKLQRLIGIIKQQNKEATASRILAVQAELKSLTVSIAAQQTKVTEASGKDAEYNTLKNAVASTQSQIDKLLGNSSDLDPKAAKPDPLVVMHSATPFRPVSPGTVKHLLMGFCGGLVVGMVLLLLMDRADDRISSSTEMLDHFSEPILGQIPNVADSRQETGLPLLQPEDDRYTYAESFRSLRSSLIFMPNQAELKTILVTSAIPNEGKSTIASNLAVTMAASGARVLLVDADLRRGDLAQLFDTDGRFGLSSILNGEVPWREAAQSTKYPTLSLIPRGPVTNQSGELLLKPELLNLLEEFKDAFDLTIFNTAPILAADDTPTLAPNFDGALMIVRAAFTSARLSQNALNTLYQRQVNVLGLVLNCIDAEMPDYYYYRYPKYYVAQ